MKLRSWVTFAMLAFCGSAMAQQETPLGGSAREVASRFNAAAERLRLAVRVQDKGCDRNVLCHLAFPAKVSGWASGVDLDDDRTETLLFQHKCETDQVTMMIEAAKVFVSMYGSPRSATDKAAFSRLTSAFASKGRASVVIGGVEFVNSNISCTLFVGRPR